jgi:Sulfotransferase family
LCQRILGTHPEIATVNEPHILLSLLYSLKDDSVVSTYSHVSAARAMQDFCESLPNGEDDLFAEMREYVLRVYQRSAQKEYRYFLDKTPKYNLIADDLVRLFPDAKFIFLWRNPLAVVASFIETWGSGRWNVFYFKIDLFQGLDNLVHAYLDHQESVLSICYEDVVRYPERTWGNVFDYLELPFDPVILSRFSATRFIGRVRDPNSDQPEYQSITATPLDKWRTILNNPLRLAWCRRYLRWIGRERLAVMGYDLDGLLADLDAVPMGFHHVAQDAFRIPAGSAFHVLELKFAQRKLTDWWNGERLYMHT